MYFASCFSQCSNICRFGNTQRPWSKVHLRNCMEVAACAAAEKRRYTLAITYDELCRKHWSQKAARTLCRLSKTRICSSVRAHCLMLAQKVRICACPCPALCCRFAFARQINEAPSQAGERKANSSQTVGKLRRSAVAVLFAVLLSRALCLFVLQLARNLAKDRGPRVTAIPKVITVVLRGARKVMVAAGEVERGKVGGWIRRVSRRQHPLISIVRKYLHVARPST